MGSPASLSRERGFLSALVRGFQWRVLYAVCLAASVAAFSFGAVSAQEESDESFINLSVNLNEYSLAIISDLDYTLEAKNRGNADATGVRVEVFLQNQKIIPGTFRSHAAAGTSYSIKRNGEGDTEVTWEIGTLRAGESKTLLLAVELDNTRDPSADSMFGRTTATISSATGEATALLHDNKVTGLAFHRLTGDSNRRAGILRDSDAAVMVSVDDQYPEAGDSVNFNLAVLNLNIPDSAFGLDNGILDVEVPVSLDPGLAFASGWTPTPSKGTFTKTNSRSGTWEVEDIRASQGQTLKVETRLTADSLASIPLEKRCFSAWVSDMTPPPDPNYILGSLTECLGDDPPVLLEEGTLGAMTAFPCIGVLTYPCVDEDGNGVSDAGVVVAAPAEADNLTVRGHGVGRVDVGATSTDPQVILRPENGIIIQVKDPQGRIFDTQSHSLTSGTTPSWQTAREPNSQSGNREVGGVTITWTRKNFNDQIADWSSYVRGVSVAGLNGSAAPGRVRVRPPRTGSVFLDPNPTAQRSALTLSSKSTSVPAFFVEFDKLGTYVFNYIAKLTRTDTTEDPNSYTGTGRYIFHVGPIAELSVRDGGANTGVPSGQRAFTIVAVSSGPDDAPAVEVEVKGLSAGDVQSHSATKGSFNPVSGVWTIGEMKTKDYVRGASGRDGEVLTIIPNSSADKEITATISNTQDYSVEISGTTHSTKYYDYIKKNDSTAIGLHKGTGEALSTLQVSGLGGAAMLARWSALPSLYGHNVRHYEIERSTDGGKSWTALDDEVVKTVYVDLDATPGNNPTYRVRAVNGLFHTGPWSSLLGPTGSSSPRGTAEAPGQPVNVGAAADGGSAIDVSWDAPTEQGGAPVTRYEVQWSADGSSGWRRAGYVQNLTYKHSGLSFDDTRYYRVRAQNSGGWGAWSDPPASATTRAGVPDAPTLTTRSTTPTTIRLRWTEPNDNGDAIIKYQIEVSEDGSVDSWESLNDNVQPTVMEYEYTVTASGAERYFRVRAVNGMGAGRWSGTKSAVAPPGSLYSFWAEPNGSNAILITWSPPDDATKGSTVTRYELEVSTDGGTTYTSLRSLGATERTFNHTGLKPGDMRHYRMRACNGAGCGQWVGGAFATVKAGVPHAPGLTARINSASEIKLSWTKPNDGGSEITKYQLHHSEDGGEWSDLNIGNSPDGTEYSHQDEFGAGTKHSYRVRAVNDMGDGAWSAVRSVTIPAAAPGRPALTVSKVKSGERDTRVDGVRTTEPTYRNDSLELSWEAPEDNGSRITGYRVERDDRGNSGYDNWVHIGTAGASATSYTDRNLYEGEQYCYRVAANSSAGTGAWSEIACESTAGSPRRPEPPIARISAVSANRVTFTWDPPADSGTRPIENYVYEKIALSSEGFNDGCEWAIWDRELWPEDTCFVKSANDRTVTFSNLEPGESYQFRVLAVTGYNDSEWAEVSVHLPLAADDPDTPDVTEDLQLRVSPASLTVNEGGEARYTVRLNKSPKEGETVKLDWDPIRLHRDLVGYTDIIVYKPEGFGYLYFNSTNWNSGFTFTVLAEEDPDSNDEILIIRHTISVDGRYVSTPDVRVVERDND